MIHSIAKNTAYFIENTIATKIGVDMFPNTIKDSRESFTESCKLFRAYMKGLEATYCRATNEKGSKTYGGWVIRDEESMDMFKSDIDGMFKIKENSTLSVPNKGSSSTPTVTITSFGDEDLTVIVTNGYSIKGYLASTKFKYQPTNRTYEKVYETMDELTVGIQDIYDYCDDIAGVKCEEKPYLEL